MLIPEGWQLVPVEPTEEMLDAAIRSTSNWIGVGKGWRGAALKYAHRYRAMLAAAPKPIIPELGAHHARDNR